MVLLSWVRICYAAYLPSTHKSTEFSVSVYDDARPSDTSHVSSTLLEILGFQEARLS